MQKKIVALIVGAGVLSCNVMAQQSNSPKSVQTPPEEKVVIGRSNTERYQDKAVPQQASNPYGSVQTSGSGVPPGVNYGDSSAQQRQIPNPSVQSRAAQAPIQPPSGLPQDASMRNYSRGEIDPLVSTVNILNTPDEEIRQVNRDIYNKGRVINEFPVTQPKSVNGVLTSSMSPGAVPPVIRLSRNRTSAIVITDMTGQPWPIANYDGLSEEDFIVKRLDNSTSEGSVLSVTPRGTFVNGNLALMLVGLPSPLLIDFVSAQKEVDTKTEIRVQARGPNTQYSSIGAPDGIDTGLLSVLQGVSPAGTKPLRVSSPAVQAWLAKDGKMYVRTRYKLLSPAFENVTSSPDGTFAYKMVPVPVVLYKATEGRFGEFSVDGF